MSSFLKKAMGIFVEFDEGNNPIESKAINIQQPIIKESNLNPKTPLNQGEIEKFEKHFEQLFDKANLPGPDYFEFWKMMDTLEVHIPDEKSRILAVFASLSIQGLTKEKLVESANHYKIVIDKDKSEFEKAVADKSKIELDSRIKAVGEFEKKIADDSALIQTLTQEITEAKNKMTALKTEISEAEQKITSSKSNYNLACDAMTTKLIQDIQKIQTTI